MQTFCLCRGNLLHSTHQVDCASNMLFNMTGGLWTIQTSNTCNSTALARYSNEEKKQMSNPTTKLDVGGWVRYVGSDYVATLKERSSWCRCDVWCGVYYCKALLELILWLTYHRYLIMTVVHWHRKVDGGAGDGERSSSWVSATAFPLRRDSQAAAWQVGYCFDLLLVVIDRDFLYDLLRIKLFPTIVSYVWSQIISQQVLCVFFFLYVSFYSLVWFLVLNDSSLSHWVMKEVRETSVDFAVVFSACAKCSGGLWEQLHGTHSWRARYHHLFVFLVYIIYNASRLICSTKNFLVHESWTTFWVWKLL